MERIVAKLGFKNIQKITSGEEVSSQEFVLLTYTDGYGEVPEIVNKFLEKNSSLLKGVAGSGNKNFGKNFCKSAYLIQEKYQVPLIMTFDLGGTDEDISKFRNHLRKLNVT